MEQYSQGVQEMAQVMLDRGAVIAREEALAISAAYEDAIYPAPLSVAEIEGAVDHFIGVYDTVDGFAHRLFGDLWEIKTPVIPFINWDAVTRDVMGDHTAVEFEDLDGEEKIAVFAD